MNAKQVAESPNLTIAYRLLVGALTVALMAVQILVVMQVDDIKSSIADTKASIGDLNKSIDEFKEKQFNPLANAVAVLQTTIDKGINQALDSQNRRIEVLEHRVDALSDRVNTLSVPSSGAKR